MITITYNGQNFDNLEDAFAKAILNGYKEIFDKKLAPFKSEIADARGKISINFTGHDYDANLKISDIPDELSERIQAALRE